MVMTFTKSLPRAIGKQYTEDNKKQALFEERASIVFLSNPRSRTNYHGRKDWVLYQINLFT